MAVSFPSTINQIGAVGASGHYLTSNGTTNTASWVQPNANFHSSNGKPVMVIPHGEDKVVIEEKAALEVKGKLKLNGVDLDERLNTIEQVLQIPTRDVTMEQKHPKLAELYKQYMRELEKYKTWERIKGENE